MKITPKYGIDKLIFGMKRPDVIAIYGTPDKKYSDEDENEILLYNALKLRLTFYEEANFKLGYIICGNENATLFDKKIIGIKESDAKNNLLGNGIKTWNNDTFDTYENYLNEDNWITLQAEFGDIVKIELGAMINEKDEFDWKF